MTYGIITLPLVPGRAEPSDKSEMVTQFVFGILYQVLDTNKKWMLIESEMDQYQCWIDLKQHTEIPESEYLRIKSNQFNYSSNVLGVISSETNGQMHIPMGSVLPSLQSDNSFEINGQKFLFEGTRSECQFENIELLAKSLLHAPYLWGGKSILGIDCSGFTQMVFRCCGILLPRDAYQQAEEGNVVDFIELTQTGDLAFFDNEEGRITHVGIMLGNSKIIHASGSVRIDTIDHQGIFHEGMAKYTHKTRIIKGFTPAQ